MAYFDRFDGFNLKGTKQKKKQDKAIEALYCIVQ